VKIDFLADTNILINLLEGDKRLEAYLDKTIAVSFVTEIELLGMQGISSTHLKASRSLLSDCLIISYSDELKEIAIGLRQKRKILLADSLIAATGIQ
jgi:predicted nucleic acid-binding protein